MREQRRPERIGDASKGPGVLVLAKHRSSRQAQRAHCERRVEAQHRAPLRIVAFARLRHGPTTMEVAQREDRRQARKRVGGAVDRVRHGLVRHCSATHRLALKCGVGRACAHCAQRLPMPAAISLRCRNLVHLRSLLNGDAVLRTAVWARGPRFASRLDHDPNPDRDLRPRSPKWAHGTGREAPS